MVKMKTLVIFDFDDTLFESQSQVVVRSPRGGIRYLSSGEYASYVPDQDDVLDFSQFEGYPPNPKPILATIGRLKQAVSRYGLDNVIILTARGQSQPVIDVIKDFNLPQIFVAAVGSSNPAMKADYTVRTIQEEGYDKIVVYEDNVRNIVAIREAVVPLLGPKNFTAYNVRQQDDSHVLVKH